MTGYPTATVNVHDLEAAGFDTSHTSRTDLEKVAQLMEISYLDGRYWTDLKAAATKVGIPKKKKTL